MAKHNQLISRTWIIAAIITQIFILGLSLPIFCQATLYHFIDNSGELTPLFFWPKELLVSDGQYNDSFEHHGQYVWWFYFNSINDCIRYNVVSRTTCATLQAIRSDNWILVIGLTVSFIFTIISLVLLILMID